MKIMTLPYRSLLYNVRLVTGRVILFLLGTGLLLALFFLSALTGPAELKAGQTASQTLSAYRQLLPPTSPVADPAQNPAAQTALPADLMASFAQVLQNEVPADYLPVALSGQEGTYRLANPAQGFAAELNSQGLKINEWSMRLTSYNYTGQPPQPLAGVQPVLTNQRVEYRYGNGVVEWYANSELGLEQGFTLEQPLQEADSGSLELNIGLEGTLAREDVPGWVGLGEEQRYGGLVVWDANHRLLPSRLSGTGSSVKLQVELQGAVYPITVDPFVAQQKLTANDAADNDRFGWSVALSGDGNTALVGAYGKNTGRGAAYVFTLSGTSWNLQQELTANDAADGDRFGYSVALSGDGNTALVGAYNKNNAQGAAYVFTRSGTTWSQQQELTAGDAANYDYFGYSVALSGDGNTALVGAYGKNNLQGAAYVFTRSGTTWSLQQILTAGDPADGDYFGYSVAMSGDGNTALVGAVVKNSSQGAAYVFTRSGTTWSQQQELTANDAANYDYFGYSVAMSGDGNTALVGAYAKNNLQGAAYVFIRSGTTWSQQQILTANDAANGDRFGWSVALSGDGITALVGAFGKNNAQGAAYTYSFTNYTPEVSLTSSPNPSQNFQSVTFTATVTGSAGVATGSVSFTVDSSPAGSFNLDSNGQATFSTAFLTPGQHTIQATYSGDFNYTQGNQPSLSQVVYGPPASVTAVSGTPQSTQVNTAFASPLVARVTDNSNNPVSGAVVTFTAPASGPSGTFANNSTVFTGTTDASGTVTTTTFTANSTAGSYNVAATVTDVGTPASYSLTNNPGPASTITAVSGTPQSTQVNTAFSSPLVAKVTDVGSNPVSSVVVTFTAPASGASGTFVGGSTVFTGTTDASGTVTTTTFTANATAGSYTVAATVSGAATPANFNLTNTSGAPGSITATSGTPQTTQVNTAFASPLVARVTDNSNNPVSSVVVTFTAPASGASGTFADNTTVYTGTTDAGGTVTSTTFTANSSTGTYNVVATAGGVATPANFNLTNTASQEKVVKVVQPPADLIAQLRVAPDRVASNEASNLISYTFTVKNIGQGRAGTVSLQLPVDPQLVIGFAVFDNPAVWVSGVTTASISVNLPGLENGQEVSGTIVMRPNPAPVPAIGSSVTTRASVKWTNPQGDDKQVPSNAVSFVFGGPGSNQDVSGGEVQLMTADPPNGTKVVCNSNFWIPDEVVTAWLTKPDGTSVELSQGRANEKGEFSFEVDTSNLAPGSYVVAAYGQRSGTYGSALLELSSSGSSQAKLAPELKLAELGKKEVIKVMTESKR